MVQPQAAQNPHFAIDFGRVREVGGELERPPEVVRRVARRQIPLRVLVSCFRGGGAKPRPADATSSKQCNTINGIIRMQKKWTCVL